VILHDILIHPNGRWVQDRGGSHEESHSVSQSPYLRFVRLIDANFDRYDQSSTGLPRGTSLINLLFIPFIFFLDQLDSVLQGKYFLGFFILDFTPECLFEVHHQLDKIEAVSAEILDEPALWRHRLFIYSKSVCDYLPSPWRYFFFRKHFCYCMSDLWCHQSVELRPPAAVLIQR
jgi:hypothetical protein